MNPLRLLAPALLLLAPLAHAEVKPSTLFADHMVLQRDLPLPVWGAAAPGETVTVAFAGQKKSAVAGADGKWRVDLDPLPASAEGRVLTITGSATAAPITRSDVLVGEVWLCSGQSNMEFTVSRAKASWAGVTNEAEEIAAANYPLIREFRARPDRLYEPQENMTADWLVCSPATVPGFSAVGYFFARELQKSIQVPIGLLTLTLGSSCAQAWVGREALAADPALAPMLEAFDSQVRTFRESRSGVMSAADVAALNTALQRAAVGADPSVQAFFEQHPGFAAFAAPPAPGGRDPVTDQHNPTVLYNGVIAPVVPYAIRGALWYQGESITFGGAELYPKIMEALIKDWRRLWGRELPFYFVQLAALDNNSNRPEVREAQAAALALPGTGMAVTLDIGSRTNVHPDNKQDLGDRLARIARANVYGEPLEYSGPVYEAMAVEGGAIRVKFSHTGGGLAAKNGPLKWFTIAGADKNFVPAEARIDGDTVLVSSPDVAAPVAVRYAWHRWPEGSNFYNAAGLPAAPFRTDR